MTWCGSVMTVWWWCGGVMEWCGGSVMLMWQLCGVVVMSWWCYDLVR